MKLKTLFYHSTLAFCLLNTSQPAFAQDFAGKLRVLNKNGRQIYSINEGETIKVKIKHTEYGHIDSKIKKIGELNVLSANKITVDNDTLSVDKIASMRIWKKNSFYSGLTFCSLSAVAIYSGYRLIESDQNCTSCSRASTLFGALIIVSTPGPLIAGFRLMKGGYRSMNKKKIILEGYE